MATEVAKYALQMLANHDPLAVGEQTRFSHARCGDGRHRLYVKRVVNEKNQLGVLAYCHNCSEGGAVYESGPYVYVGAGTKPTVTPKETLPADYETANQVANDYLAEYGFTAMDAEFYGVGWSENYQRIALPVQDGPGAPVKGCQLRRVGDYGPKYITMRPTAEPLECVWGGTSNSTTVITEDLLSAWRVWQAGYAAVPLLGAHVRPERLARMINDGHKDWVIWLDGDKPEINDAARYMGNLLRALGAEARVASFIQEPKHYDAGSVQKMLGAS